ncbi:MAG TPA: peptide deformylase [Planctomycetes bacterium]|nr:peptide deformylase [Planctomycetota bacterium]
MMRNMKLTWYPDPVLRRRAKDIAEFTQELAARVETMFEIMEGEGGIGLAAPQAAWGARVFVTRIPAGEVEGPRRVYVNPVVVSAEGRDEAEEGCLSFPDIRARIVRHARVVLRAQDLEGRPFEEEAAGLGARCWEHEIDHLDGILFITRFKAGDLLQAKPKLLELEEKHAARTRAGRKART